MVWHYWLRNSQLAPTTEIRDSINKAITMIETFSSEVHKGIITGESGRFEHLLVVGIGGSALGPQFVSKALSQPREDKLQAWFIDNTDPDGIDHIKCKLENLLGNVRLFYALDTELKMNNIQRGSKGARVVPSQ